MNLLPIVITIVLVLGMFSLSQFQRTNSMQKEKNTYLAYFVGLRKTRNALESSAYAKKRETKSKKGGKKKRGKEIFFRDRKIGWPSGRLNLSSLIDNPKKHPELENFALEYLNALYGHTKFFPEDPAQLLTHLIAQLSEEKERIPLHELELDSANGKEVFYKMLRGTNTYNIVTKEGYPPFDHFFTFEKSVSAPINFHSANQILLEVLLGNEASHNLIALEKEKLKERPNALRSPLKRGDLQTLKLDLLNFKSPDNTKGQEIFVDAETKITVRIE